ncbi:hypothetical protein [Kitasatospora sp. NPDC057223]|uniref:DUF7617 domain-containing protein n=1 Tax=Kitasatospora sp. NPDC057223 TaxID=3346055 RepID=UPI00363BDC6D
MLKSLRPPVPTRLLRAVTAAALTATLLSGLGDLAPGAAAAPADTTTAPSGTSTLAKSAQNVTHPGASPADHGDTVNWVVRYDNAATGGAAAPAVLTDPVTGAGSAQSYLPGSLHAPPGWTPSWSTDGTSFGAVDPGAATKAVRAENPVARPGGTGLSAPLLAPVRPTAQSTGGDGFTPVLYRTASGEVESWNIYHHAGTTARQVVCSSLSAGQPCTGGPWPRPLNTTPGPLGAGNTGDIGSPLTPQYVLDPGRPGVVYYPAVTAGSVGVGCLDLGARANCGYFALASTAAAPSTANNLAGLVAVGGNLYGVANTGQVLCLAITTRTPCAGQPYAPVVTPNHDLPNTPGALYLGALTTIGDKVFASSSPQNGSTTAGPPTLGCFDTATLAACTGWSTPLPAGPNAGYYTYNAYTSYDTAGHPDGVCTTTVGGSTLLTTCYRPDGSALPAPATLATLAGGVLTFNPETVTDGGGTRSYFPVWGGGVPGATVCHDWTHAAPCAGFPTPALHPGVNGGNTRDYGYSYDATTRCLIGLGDAGVLFSLDPASGATPCVHSGAAVTLKPADFYCDGAPGHVQGYTQARLTDIDLANVDLAASRVIVTDPDGSTVATPALSPAGTVDLSAVSVTAHPAITVTAQLVLNGAGDFTPDNHPTLVVEYRGDAPQLCFRTTVTTDCATAQISNTATGTDATGALTSNTVTVPVAPGAGCRPQVTVNKEICASDNPHNCGPGGPGPWAKTSPVGLLRLLGTAYWRITVSNAGPVDAAAVSVNDAVTPSCRSAAGTFTLASGSSRQVYCNSFLLALPMKNTASASFVAANSPAGTAPTTSTPSSAVACSLLCILAAPGRD